MSYEGEDLIWVGLWFPLVHYFGPPSLPPPQTYRRNCVGKKQIEKGRGETLWDLCLISAKASQEEKPQGKEYVVESIEPAKFMLGSPRQWHKYKLGSSLGGCLSTPQPLCRDIPQPKAPWWFPPQKRQTGIMARMLDWRAESQSSY